MGLFVSVLVRCQWSIVDMKKQHILFIYQPSGHDKKNDRFYLYRRMPLSPPPHNVEPIQPTHFVPHLAHILSHLGFTANKEHRHSNFHGLCLLFIAPVESPLAAEVTEAGVPQSCRKTQLLCSSQVREDRTSLLWLLWLINIF